MPKQPTRFSPRPFSSRRGALALAVAAGVLGVPFCVLPQTPVSAAPEPAPVPVRWELEFEPGPLRIARVTETDGSQAYYYYMTYKVTNLTDQDRLFAPLFDLKTEEGELLRAGRNVSAAATRTILERLRNPLLEDPISIVGSLRQGEENAKFGIAIWPAQRLGVDEITVFAAGFSGESETYRARDAETGRYRDYVLRKTRMLRHAAPGDLDEMVDRPLQRIEERWVMR